jgi:hypothetical protein
MQDFRDDFAAALLDPDLPVPPGVISARASNLVGRFGIYRNNVAVALTDALAARFPATCRIVGEDFFGATARLFTVQHPPKSPLMMFYGDDFPDFLASFPPAATIPYLADVARLEAARTRAYHAADATPLAPDDLAIALQRTGEDLGLFLHPSMEIVGSLFPIVTIWAMNAGETEPAPVADWSGEDALVARPALDVEVTCLPPGGARFLGLLQQGATIGAGARTVFAEIERFDLAESLALLLGSGVVVGSSQDPETGSVSDQVL